MLSCAMEDSAGSCVHNQVEFTRGPVALQPRRAGPAVRSTAGVSPGHLKPRYLCALLKPRLR